MTATSKGNSEGGDFFMAVTLGAIMVLGAVDFLVSLVILVLTMLFEFSPLLFAVALVGLVVGGFFVIRGIIRGSKRRKALRAVRDAETDALAAVQPAIAFIFGGDRERYFHLEDEGRVVVDAHAFEAAAFERDTDFAQRVADAEYDYARGSEPGTIVLTPLVKAGE